MKQTNKFSRLLTTLGIILIFFAFTCVTAFAATEGVTDDPTDRQKFVAYCAIGLIAFCFIYKFIRDKIIK